MIKYRLLKERETPPRYAYLINTDLTQVKQIVKNWEFNGYDSFAAWTENVTSTVQKRPFDTPVWAIWYEDIEPWGNEELSP